MHPNLTFFHFDHIIADMTWNYPVNQKKTCPMCGTGYPHFNLGLLHRKA
ncbi:hypothetical protein EDO6_03162 [Paenibacillus xylanexedens]|nr:hypothetical protein EDO6_03162 [Paenibacillus xylanexedens]